MCFVTVWTLTVLLSIGKFRYRLLPPLRHSNHTTAEMVLARSKKSNDAKLLTRKLMAMKNFINNGIHRRLQICNSLYRRGDNVVFPTRVLEVIQNEVNGYDMATTALRTILEVPNKKSVKLANKAVKIFEQDLMLNTVIPAISLFSQSACHPPAGGAIHSSS